MARTGELPFRPYYGSVDATPLWLILLAATYDWTGDRELVDRLWPNALRALEWIDRWGDRDGDGFVEYERRTPSGLVNQGWKDSSDGIRDRHGTPARTPIALAEVQGYVFDAKIRIAALARMRGDEVLASRLEADAETLRQRFEAAFWSDDQACYAMALDGEKRQADAIASNAGHCLWSGIASPERASRVVDRLMAPDMFSGWGIRTYAAGQPGYNPIGYHSGTIWPHDVSLIAAGFKRYGRHEEANRLVGRIFEAAQHFADFRLPELFCGFDREQSPIPVPYPVACSPQAWAAGSTFLFLETMLGLRPHADRRELELERPELPGLAAEGDGVQPARRRRDGRPAVPPLARRDVRRGHPQEPRPRRHHPDVAPPCPTPPSPCPSSSRWAPSESPPRARVPPASTRSCCSARRWASTGPASSPTPTRPSGPTRARRSTRPSRGASAASPSPTSAASASSTAWPSPPMRGR